MAWNVKKFLYSFKRKKYAYFCGKFTTFPLAQNKSLIVKTASDLHLIESIIKNKKNLKVKYHRLIKFK